MRLHDRDMAAAGFWFWFLSVPGVRACTVTAVTGPAHQSGHIIPMSAPTTAQAVSHVAQYLGDTFDAYAAIYDRTTLEVRLVVRDDAVNTGARTRIASACAVDAFFVDCRLDLEYAESLRAFAARASNAHAGDSTFRLEVVCGGNVVAARNLSDGDDDDKLAPAPAPPACVCGLRKRGLGEGRLPRS